MDEYIEKQAAIDEVCAWLKDRMTVAKNGKPLTDRLRDLPSADVVPVVRCRDCRYHVAIDKCCHPDGLLCAKDNNFCNYGERKG